MNAVERNIEGPLLHDLAKKFVFLSGPRQVGKTTIAKRLIKKQDGVYLLYDDENDRAQILNKSYVHNRWVCLDEFHKFPRWKAHLKGVFDKYHEALHLLLTGSARLDVYQRSGDSLLGRYYLHHLHPLSCGELASVTPTQLPTSLLEPNAPSEGIEELLAFGGFPEPFYAQSEAEHRRWSNARRHLLVREDLRELTQIQLIALVEQLMLVLPQRIGSLFSYRSLAEDVRVSPPTVQQWMNVFERLFIAFKITPYSKKIIRSLQKQPKYYLYDWSQIADSGSRFENFVASHLWKAVQIWTDLGLADLSLHFIRDRDQREVDFLLVKNGTPWFLVECKESESRPADHLQYFSERLRVPAVQLLLKKGVFRQEGNITILSADQWLTKLP